MEKLCTDLSIVASSVFPAKEIVEFEYQPYYKKVVYEFDDGSREEFVSKNISGWSFSFMTSVYVIPKFVPIQNPIDALFHALMSFTGTKVVGIEGHEINEQLFVCRVALDGGISLGWADNPAWAMIMAFVAYEVQLEEFANINGEMSDESL